MRAVGCRAAALALAAAGSLWIPAGAARAEGGHRAWAELRLAYDRAEVSRDRRFAAYDFVVSNEGGSSAVGVLVVHQVRPRRRVVWASWPCQVRAEAVRCAYGRLRAGRARSGRIVVRLPEGADVPQVRGRAGGWESDAGSRGPGAG